jgi:ABC-2 type transport system ATP-binding protein
MALLDRLDAHAVSVERVTVHTADLDDVFFALTGRSHKGPNNGPNEEPHEG